MRKSSIHIQAGNAGYFFHNDRSKQTANAIFKDAKNEYYNDALSALELFRTELRKRTDEYTKRTGKKLHKNTITHLSAILNLDERHTLQDVKKVAEYLEKLLDTKVVQIAVHADEGWIDKTGEKHTNHHAHLEMVGLDSKGNSIRRKLNRKTLIHLQDKIAEILNMPRGINYTKEKKKRPRRLNTYEYKEHARRKSLELKPLLEELEKEKITRKKVEEELKKLRQELINKNKQLEEQNKQKIYTQEDYKSLTALKKELKANNAQEIYKKFLELRSKLENKAKKLEEENNDLKKKIKELEKTAKELQEKVKELKKFVNTYALTIKHNTNAHDKTLYLDLNEYDYERVSEKDIFKINYDWGYITDDTENNIIKIKIFAPTKNNQEESIYKAVEDIYQLLKDKEIDLSNIQIVSDNEELKEEIKFKLFLSNRKRNKNNLGNSVKNKM